MGILPIHGTNHNGLEALSDYMDDPNFFSRLFTGRAHNVLHLGPFWPLSFLGAWVSGTLLDTESLIFRPAADGVCEDGKLFVQEGWCLAKYSSCAEVALAEDAGDLSPHSPALGRQKTC